MTIKLSEEWVIQSEKYNYNNRAELYHKPCINTDYPLSISGFANYSTDSNDSQCYYCDSCQADPPIDVVKKFKFIAGSK